MFQPLEYYTILCCFIQSENCSVAVMLTHQVTVAVKVLHPNIRASMDVDLALLKIGAWLFECLPGMKWLASVRAVNNFSQTMLPQVISFSWQCF